MQNDNEMNLIRWSKSVMSYERLINCKYVKMIWDRYIIWFMEFPLPSAGKMTQNFINRIQWTMRTKTHNHPPYHTHTHTHILINGECEYRSLIENKALNRTQNQSNQLSVIKSAKIKLSRYNDFRRKKAKKKDKKRRIEREEIAKLRESTISLSCAS